MIAKFTNIKELFIYFVRLLCVGEFVRLYVCKILVSEQKQTTSINLRKGFFQSKPIMKSHLLA